LAEFERDTASDWDAGRIIQFLRDLGPLRFLESALRSEADAEGLTNLPKLSSDSFRVWASNYRAFGQIHMAERMEGLEEALYSLAQEGIPGTSIHVLDHGICGGLLLLKYSTYWFRFFFALQQATPLSGTPEAELQNSMRSQLKGKHPYHAIHWWRSIVWATAAVALHNVQQSTSFPGWKGKLSLTEDPLAYLGILVDILQDWDRHSMRRIPAIESDRRIINSNDVTIGKNPDGRISIRYGCRDQSAAERQRKTENDLDAALADWNRIVEFSFHSI
jgi:hypothetical protein